MKLRILSWNIWINGYFDQVAAFLKKSQVDIIGLQEVVDNDPKRDVINMLSKLGYEYAFGSVEHSWGGKVYRDGPAIFSKHKITKTETYILSEKDKRAAVKADILVGDKTLHVFSTHLIHTHQKGSEEQDIQVSNLIKKLTTERTVLMGDFNATPESSVIKSMQKVLVNSDPSFTPTWSVYPEGCRICNPQKLDTCLDYIFTSKDLKTSSFKVEGSKASDHLPISVVVEI